MRSTSRVTRVELVVAGNYYRVHYAKGEIEKIEVGFYSKANHLCFRSIGRYGSTWWKVIDAVNQGNQP